jgi:hypothetical protein
MSEKLIDISLIVGMVYREAVKRMNSFGYEDVLKDTTDKKFIDQCIIQKIENEYFDKFGNYFSHEQINY